MNEPSETQVTLAGLELESEQPGRSGALRTAVVATIKALQDERLLEPRHAAMCQLALELADAVTAGTRSRRASAAAMAAAQLLAVLKELPAPMAADLKQRFDQFVDSLVNGDPEP